MRFIVIVTAFATIPLFVSAHATGVSFEKEVGNYLVDIGYDVPQPVAGDRLVFDFNLSAREDTRPIEFDYVWVRIEREKKTLVATAVSRAEFGPTSLLYVLPDTAGDLSVSARYQLGNDALAEVAFVIPIQPQKREYGDYVPWLLCAALGVGIGGGAVFIISRRTVV